MIAQAQDEEVLDLMDSLPCEREENRERLAHTKRYGHIVKLFERDELVGVAECYTMDYVPSWPLEVGPVSVPDGKYLYIVSAVSKKNRIKDLIELGKRRFPNCTEICYHRDKYNHRLYKMRI